MGKIDKNRVILVDENDNVKGYTDKLQAHTDALLHRAVSVFIADSDGNWILQQRAPDKYHSEGLWTNACCTHPAPGETNYNAARRRLIEEMGIDCELKELFSFIYKEDVGNGLTEYEYDHVFFGVSDDLPLININEVMDWKKLPFSVLKKDVEDNPSSYTVWFRKVFEDVFDHLKKEK